MKQPVVHVPPSVQRGACVAFPEQGAVTGYDELAKNAQTGTIAGVQVPALGRMHKVLEADITESTGLDLNRIRTEGADHQPSRG